MQLNKNCINPDEPKRKIPWLVNAVDTLIGDEVSFQRTGQTVYNALDSLLSENMNVGFAINFDPRNKKLIFEVRMEIAKKYFREGQRILLPHLNTAKAYEIELIDCAPVSKVIIFAKQGVLVEEDDIENMLAFNGEKKELHKEAEEVNIIGEDSIIKEGIYKVNLEGLTFKNTEHQKSGKIEKGELNTIFEEDSKDRFVAVYNHVCPYRLGVFPCA